MVSTTFLTVVAAVVVCFTVRAESLGQHLTHMLPVQLLLPFFVTTRSWVFGRKAKVLVGRADAPPAILSGDSDEARARKKGNSRSESANLIDGKGYV
jgi:hypothetical protein